MRIGTILSKWRRMEGRTLKSVAKEIGIAISTLQKLESGASGTVDGDTLSKVLVWLLKDWTTKAVKIAPVILVVILTLGLFAEPLRGDNLLDGPKPQQVKRPLRSVSFWSLTAVNAAAFSYDGYQTMRWTEQRPLGRPCAGEGWNSWLYGQRPSSARVAFTMAGQFALSEIGGYVMARSRNKTLRKLWWVPMSFTSVDHLHGGLSWRGC